MSRKHVKLTPARLNQARNLLGLSQVRLALVAQAVCERQQVPCPVTHQEKRAVIVAFIESVMPPRIAKVSGAPAPVVSHRQTRKDAQAASDRFLMSYEWRKLRMVVISKRGTTCECCGASPKDGIRINVDHVKPRKLFPELALDESNLQVLCEDCNHGKGNWDQTDWRDHDTDQVLAGSRLRPF